MPDDAREAWRSTDAEGLTQVRYQQYVGEAAVYGGQITTLSRDGERVAVTGSYYPNLDPTDEVRTTPADARALAEREEPGTGGRKNVTLFIDPKDGSRFYEVDSRDFDKRRVYHVDARTGKKIKEYDNIQEAQETASDPGVGIKGDTKRQLRRVLRPGWRPRPGGPPGLADRRGRLPRRDHRPRFPQHGRPGRGRRPRPLL